MVEDPWKVLGLQPGAGQEEIKKAYRKKIREYHPDLHPNDPAAAEKTNEINEAYDMLQNPEKYEARRRQQTRTPYGTGEQRGGYDACRNAETGKAYYGNFDFEDLFGFGFGNARADTGTRPDLRPGDSPEIRNAVQAINATQYQNAVRILMNIPGGKRNARWHYLFSLACRGGGDRSRALDEMQRAVQMDPDNRTYHLLLQQFREEEQSQSRGQTGQGSPVMPFFSIGKIFAWILAAQILLSLLQMIFGFGGHPYYLYLH